MPDGEIVGAAVGAIVVVAAAIGAFWWIQKKKMSEAKTISDGESGLDRSSGAMTNNGYMSLDTRAAPFVAPDAAAPPETDSAAVNGYPEVVGEAAAPSGNVYE